MSNFVAIVDPDERRRRSFLGASAARLSLVDGLQLRCVADGDFAAAWVSHRRAPISTANDRGRVGVLWGEALAGLDSRRLAASDVLAMSEPERAPPPLDGFHAGIIYGPTSSLIAHADLLGLFPVYYAARRDVIVVGSSAELFPMHPLFPVRLSTEGLIGVLLTHAPIGGLTLVKDVRRLAAGHALVWRRAHEAHECRTFAIPAPPEGNSVAFHQAMEELDQTYAEVIRRHAPPDSSTGLLLSGGRDSRTLAGYLRRQGNHVRALTLGLPTDYDAQFAAAVARRVRFEHEIVEIGPERFSWAARMQADWEHLSSGFSSIHTWGAVENVRHLPARLVCGHNADMTRPTGVPSDAFGVESEREALSFDGFLRFTSARALSPDVLRGLLRFPGAGEEIDATICRLREVYETCAPVAPQRPWRFYLSHHCRFHAGAVPWRLAFGSWPVLPVLDRQLLACLAAVPAAYLAGRRAQDYILRSRFPDLAKLPLDRNSHWIEPLHVPLHRRAVRALRARVAPREARPRPGDDVVERRYYHRMYDFNGPGWQSVRRVADADRDRVADLIDLDVLARVLPPAGTIVPLADGIRDGFGPKLLVGLLLWARTHLP